MPENAGRLDMAIANLDELNQGWAENHNSPHELFQRMRYELLTEITEAEKAWGMARLTLKASEEHAQTIVVQASAEAAGKNAEERKAALADLLVRDQAYQRVKEGVYKGEGAVIDAEARLNQLKREWQALSLQIQFRIQVLAFLSSPQ
ncbi:MAG: hypothetical protein Q8R28_11145 [Dehalococcoidia bacterium]|nr:hypothetical protein [Dehalococcoidia bacterium]